MFADRESALVRVCSVCEMCKCVCVCVCVCVCMCVCPGEEFLPAAGVSRLHCKAEVHSGLINLTRAAHSECGAWDSEGTIPLDHPGPGIPPGLLLMAKWESFRMPHIHYSTCAHLYDYSGSFNSFSNARFALI